ncbi:MAG: alpha-amylase family glycosyl hydrolase [Ignavibacteria bacterium]|jgi:glycosidase
MTKNSTLIQSQEDLFDCKNLPKYEFHIAKEIRKKYGFEDELFSVTGNVIFRNNTAVRNFTHKINGKRKDDKKIKISLVNAVGLLDEIYHYVIRVYEENENPGVFARGIDYLKNSIGDISLNKILLEFVLLFPPMEVVKRHISSFDYLNSYTGNKPNTEIVIEELMLLYFCNFNPAGESLKELFDDSYFSSKSLYRSVVNKLDEFFQNEKPFGPDKQDIFNLLKTPIMNSPENIEAQFDFIKNRWKSIIGEEFLKRIMLGKDLIKEDIVFDTLGGGGGGAPTVTPKYKGDVDLGDVLMIGKSMYKYAKDSVSDYDEPEAFTKDIDWMPNIVLLAKNTYVWLDQLSKQYKRHIHRLDQIPDEELDRIAARNFNGLWLIGIWERSKASKRIKHIMGNIDAVASAYSLFDYEIAHDLGGEEAYNNLNERAKARGIRLASDMVPNHTGIYSRWVIEHPEYFIQSNQPPFPSYTFTGENLSENPNYQIRIEDGYYRKSDAAVVFQRINNNTGEVKYFYHGNDGTNMPWNDTAQLDFLKKEVREAVIQKIFDVAKKFSIIRFDAAMTLTKRHFSRLWYPQPGLGGDIPSRSDYALTKEEFDKNIPEEFWREVVDRINAEMPETLLLAEAFWLMEGYFVRSLGMHRVYNSAFMNMMMKEENEKYRDLITNTLEFEPEILKRYVNFMSNPDEETAVRQFGSDDKYFGVCVLMVTLPGLPMFAHGQVEGFHEKYGMEFKRAYYNEEQNQRLVEKHEKEVFLLMQRRFMFSQVRNFNFYDFIDDYGNLNENVFAYSNLEYGERSLIFYNNKYDSTSGKIHTSVPKLDGDKNLKQISLAEALEIKNDPNYFYIFRNHITDLEYIKRGADFHKDGFEIELEAFKYAVFLKFAEVYDATGDYTKLEGHLGGNGSYDIHRTLNELRLKPIHDAFENIFIEEEINKLIDDTITHVEEEKVIDYDLEVISTNFGKLIDIIKYKYNYDDKFEICLQNFKKEIEAVRDINKLLLKEFPGKGNIKYSNIHKDFELSIKHNYKENILLYLINNVITLIDEMFEPIKKREEESFVQRLLLDKPVRHLLERHGKGEESRLKKLTLLNVLLKFNGDLFNVADKKAEPDELKNSSQIIKYLKGNKADLIKEILNNEFVQIFIGVNEYEGIKYYSKENFEDLMNWIFTLTLIDYNLKCKSGNIVELIKGSYLICEAIKNISVQSDYKLEELKKTFLK